jgi:hypothetical protein
MFDTIKSWFGLGSPSDDPPPLVQHQRPQPPIPQTFEQKLEAEQAKVQPLVEQIDSILEKASKDTDLQNALVHKKPEKTEEDKEPSPDISDMIIRQYLMENNKTFQMLTESLMQRILSLDGLEPLDDTHRKNRKQLIVSIQQAQKRIDDFKEILMKKIEQFTPLPETSDKRESYLPEGVPSTYALNSQELGERIEGDGDAFIEEQIAKLTKQLELAKKNKNHNKVKSMKQKLKKLQEAKERR